jgi:protein-L-isoaspartate(D-aspartate) O-methyltransferase
MAWRSHGTNNVELVEALERNGIIKTKAVRDAMLAIDRGNFAPSNPYLDAPQPLMATGQTISAPHMHAHALELLKDYIRPGATVLDVGSGSGYLATAMAYMVQPGGACYGIDDIDDLVKWSLHSIKKDGKEDWLSQGKLTIMKGDGSKGFAEKAPFDAIHVGAAAPEIPPDLVKQLKSPGRMVIPVGKQSEDQVLMVITKDNEGKLEKFVATGVRYVPLRMERSAA